MHTMRLMKSCTSCGAQTPEDVRFCSSCGRPMSSISSQEGNPSAGHDTPTLELSSILASAPEDPHPPQLGAFAPGTLLAKRYRIVALLGRGGMGEVYRAEDLKLGNTVALKFLAPALQDNAAALTHLHDEVRNARQISHPNVCRVYDIGEVDGQHFLIMEYVDGEDLASLLRRIGRLPADKALETSQQICAGLSAAHDAGLLHRDLKPANIMLDGRGRARITDFGLALSSEMSLTRKTTAGTPPYMAPEQISKGETSVRSDIYSLGLVLYEIFTGRFPYKNPSRPTDSSGTPLAAADSTESWEHIHLESVPPRPSEVVSDIDPVVENTILDCLQKDPSARPATVQQVAASLPSIQQASARASTASTGMTTASGRMRSIQSAATMPEQAKSAGVAMRIGLSLAVLIAIAAVAWFYFNRPRPLPFEHYTIGRAMDSQHVRVTAISPDGNYIAAVITDAKGSQSLWVHNVPTNSERAILQDPSIHYEDLIFSPDTSYIYFSTPSAGENNSDDDEYRVPVLGGTPSRVFQSLGSPLTFIGTNRVCIYREDDSAGVWKFLNASADGGDEKILYSGKGTFPHIPTCSPDGTTAIVEDDDGKLDSVKFATGVRQPFAQAASGRWFYYVQWDAKAKGLFAITVQKSHFSGQLAYLTYPAGKLSEITNDLNDYSGVSVTADSKTIATTQKERNTRFINMPLANPSQLQEHQFSSLEWFTWLDSNRILVSGEDSTLKVADLLQDQTTTLNIAKDHFFFQPALCGPNSMVASGNTTDQKNPGIYKMQRDGSVATRLSQGVQDLWPQCTPDGKQLFYSDDHDNDQARLLRLPLDGGTAKKLADGVYYQMAADGKFLAVHYFFKESRIQLLSPETGQPLKSIPLQPEASHFFALSSDSKSLFYFTHQEAQTTVWQMALDHPRPVKLTTLPGRAIRFMQASPDGATLGMIVQKPESQVLLLREVH